MMIPKKLSWRWRIFIVVLVSNFLRCDGLDLQTVISSIIKDNQNMCFKCGFAISAIMNIAKVNDPLAAEAKLKPMCDVFKLSKDVCSGILNLFMPVLADVSKLISIKPHQICSMFMEGICPGVSVPKHEWTVKLSNVSKPPAANLPLQEIDDTNLKVLQLNDIHLDMHYSEGSNANCQDSLCCRSFSNNKNLGVYFPAGRWGAYTCDLPVETVARTLEHIGKQHPDIDYIMWIGDFVPHDIWRENQTEVLTTIRKSVEQMKKAFPSTLVLPSIGNHDTVPVGTFAPSWVEQDNHQMTWLLSELYSLWKDWLPESAKSTFLRGGFYSVLIRPGFKVISLNMNFAHNLNWWLYVNSTDPNGQLEWLANQLQDAEDTGEKVHIMGHIPPGDKSCLKTWSENYYQIINRYENTVVAQFHAHTHADEFKLFYDEQDKARPVSVSYIGPSLTPFIGYNPAYRIYYIDSNSTWEVLDHETWIFDLDKANAEIQNIPEWSLSYSAKETYNLTSLRPTEWNKLIHRMENDDSIFKIFYKNYHRSSPSSHRSTPKKKAQILCSLKCGKSHSLTKICGKKVQFSSIKV